MQLKAFTFANQITQKDSGHKTWEDKGEKKKNNDNLKKMSVSAYILWSTSCIIKLLNSYCVKLNSKITPSIMVCQENSNVWVSVFTSFNKICLLHGTAARAFHDSSVITASHKHKQMSRNCCTVVVKALHILDLFIFCDISSSLSPFTWDM